MNSARLSTPIERGLAIVAMVMAGLFSLWLLSAATIDNLAGLAWVLGCVAWVAFPYLVLAHASERLCTTWVSRVLIGLGLVGCTAYGMWAFSFVDEDALVWLAKLVVPFYQLVGAGSVYLLVIVIEVVNRRLVRLGS